MNGLDRFSTLLSAACINVALVPVGRIAEERFHSYANRLNKYHTLSMQQITPYPEYNHAETVFQNLSWREGFLRLAFLPQWQLLADEPREVDWDGVQAQKRCLVVIGICHCPSETNLVEAFDAFQVALGKFPTHVISRWCAFESTEEMSSLEEKDLTRMLEAGLEVFHQDRALDDGRSAVDFQMEIVVTNFCTKLLHKFELMICEAKNAVQALELPSMTSSEVQKSFAESYVATLLGGITHPGDAVTLTKPPEKLVKKRQTGRLQVWIGSLYLLAGVPLDASEYFTQAITNCNAAEDRIWLVVGLEGLASAAFLNEYNGVALAEEKAEAQGGEVELNGRIIELLERSLEQFKALEGEQYLLIEAESVLKLCRYRCYVGDVDKSTVLSRMSSFLDKMDAICDSLPKNESTANSAEHPLKIKLDFCLEASVLCSYMGLHRKIALFTLHAAAILVDLGADWRDVWSIQAASARFCGVGTQFVRQQNEGSMSSGSTTTWTHVKRALLRSLISLAARAHRHEDKLDYLFQLLSLAQTEADAQVILKDFDAILHRPAGTPSIQFADNSPPPFPVIEKVYPSTSTTQPQVVKERTVGMSEQPKSTFLYSPYQDRHVSNNSDVAQQVLVTAVQGEECSLLVELTNPCAFTLPIDRIALSFGSSAVDTVSCRSANLRLPAFTSHHVCCLTFLPLSPLTIHLHGVHISVFGVSFTCAVPEEKAAIRVLPKLPLLTRSPSRAKDFELMEGEHAYEEIVVKNRSARDVDRITIRAVIYVDGDQMSSSTVHQNTLSMEGLVSAGEALYTNRSPNPGANAQEKYLVSYRTCLGSNLDEQVVKSSTSDMVNRVIKVQNSLPKRIAVGEVWKLRLRFTALPGLKKATVSVLYGSTDVGPTMTNAPGSEESPQEGWYQRELCLDFTFAVANGLKVVNVSMEEAEEPTTALALIDMANHTRDVRFRVSCVNHALQHPEQHTVVEPLSVSRVALVVPRTVKVKNVRAGPWEDILAHLDASAVVLWTCEQSSRHGVLANHLLHNRDFLSAPVHDVLRIAQASPLDLQWTTALMVEGGQHDAVVGTLTVRNATSEETLEGVTVRLNPKVVNKASFHCTGTLAFHLDALTPGQVATHKISFFCLEPEAGLEVVAEEKHARKWTHRFPTALVAR